ncbi:MAG: hypothetical protein RMK65_11580 [Anaerolineae bacterium]|nr:hypothetical protein [Anaerolineae bacterium]
MANFKVVGKPIRRFDALSKAVGATLFADDFKMPGMLHGKVLRSPYPSARIVRIDPSRARALPGVVCVLTAADIGYAKMVADIPGQTGQRERPRSETPVLAWDRVRYKGEAVALVAAETEEIAERLELIDVEYEPYALASLTPWRR